MDNKANTLNKLNSANVTSFDRCEVDSREIVLNGFNRFDPKYISIGPKALRESTLTSTNINKCATLRHAGRYGGSLSDRGQIPVLKKASPPNIATVLKEFKSCESKDRMKADMDNSLRNNIKTIYDGSNASLTVIDNEIIAKRETQIISNRFYQRPIAAASKNDILHGSVGNNSSECSDHNWHGARGENIQQTEKYPDPKLLKNSENSQQSIFQSLPDLPPKMNNYRTDQQFLSASKLENYRVSKTIHKNDTTENKYGANKFSNTRGQSKYIDSSICETFNDVDQPPVLPPKNRNRNQKDFRSLKETINPKKQEMQFNIRNQPFIQKSKNSSIEHHKRLKNRAPLEKFECDPIPREMPKQNFDRDNSRPFTVQNPRDVYNDQKKLSLQRQHNNQKMSCRLREQVTHDFEILGETRGHDHQYVCSNNIRQYKSNSNSLAAYQRRNRVDEMRQYRSANTLQKKSSSFKDLEEPTSHAGINRSTFLWV